MARALVLVVILLAAIAVAPFAEASTKKYNVIEKPVTELQKELTRKICNINIKLMYLIKEKDQFNIQAGYCTSSS
ncbi:hypothetical protein OsJ_16552 [Oryza sativa Japonica Group]|uniref:Uncharacterized protein n=1 Tax=Oryza sativa subsp. japonica TaxID=39947 RepID=A3AYF3_ORYSJ|nr:hypothetical protein OsJ_16552 [Oryza sativa Japonica Group]